MERSSPTRSTSATTCAPPGRTDKPRCSAIAASATDIPRHGARRRLNSVGIVPRRTRSRRIRMAKRSAKQRPAAKTAAKLTSRPVAHARNSSRRKPSTKSEPTKTSLLAKPDGSLRSGRPPRKAVPATPPLRVAATATPSKTRTSRRNWWKRSRCYKRPWVN